MDKHIIPMPYSGFCRYGTTGHPYCIKPNCPCECHKPRKEESNG